MTAYLSIKALDRVSTREKGEEVCMASTAPIGLDMDRTLVFSNLYPFGKRLANPYPIFPHHPWIKSIGSGDSHVGTGIYLK